MSKNGSTDEAELDKLHALFKKVQSEESTFTTTLSERNVVDIVEKLVKTEKIEVIHTLSLSKEYVTRHHLIEEIKEELLLAGGRLSIFSLQSILDVDMHHVREGIEEMLKFE